MKKTLMNVKVTMVTNDEEKGFEKKVTIAWGNRLYEGGVRERQGGMRAVWEGAKKEAVRKINFRRKKINLWTS